MVGGAHVVDGRGPEPKRPACCMLVTAAQVRLWQTDGRRRMLLSVAGVEAGSGSRKHMCD